MKFIRTSSNWPDEREEIEIATLEELAAMPDEEGHCVIIWNKKDHTNDNEIRILEVYDGLREQKDSDAGAGAGPEWELSVDKHGYIIATLVPISGVINRSS